MPYVYTHKVWRKWKEPFGTPPDPTPTHDIKYFLSYKMACFTKNEVARYEPVHNVFYDIDNVV